MFDSSVILPSIRFNPIPKTPLLWAGTAIVPADKKSIAAHPTKKLRYVISPPLLGRDPAF
jgi:hypothetical protein